MIAWSWRSVWGGGQQCPHNRVRAKYGVPPDLGWRRCLIPDVIYDTLHKSRLEPNPHHVSYVNEIKRELETVCKFSVSPGTWFFGEHWRGAGWLGRVTRPIGSDVGVMSRKDITRFRLRLPRDWYLWMRTNQAPTQPTTLDPQPPPGGGFPKWKGNMDTGCTVLRVFNIHPWYPSPRCVCDKTGWYCGPALRETSGEVLK